jgi:hypothetical protein
MEFDIPEPQISRPLAGTCQHRWQNLETPFYQAQLCDLCKLYRYKAAQAADWEYRAPIPRVPTGENE